MKSDASPKSAGCDPLADHPTIPCQAAHCNLKEALDSKPPRNENPEGYEDYGRCDYGGA